MHRIHHKEDDLLLTEVYVPLHHALTAALVELIVFIVTLLLDLHLH
jgi:hypothetical protein